MIMSVNTSLIKLIYPKRRLGEGDWTSATVVAIASVAGPTLAAGDIVCRFLALVVRHQCPCWCSYLFYGA